MELERSHEKGGNVVDVSRGFRPFRRKPAADRKKAQKGVVARTGTVILEKCLRKKRIPLGEKSKGVSREKRHPRRGKALRHARTPRRSRGGTLSVHPFLFLQAFQRRPLRASASGSVLLGAFHTSHTSRHSHSSSQYAYSGAQHIAPPASPTERRGTDTTTLSPGNRHFRRFQRKATAILTGIAGSNVGQQFSRNVRCNPDSAVVDDLIVQYCKRRKGPREAWGRTPRRKTLFLQASQRKGVAGSLRGSRGR